uniref:Bet v I/Major latex protein domain-containing protein n=1 Tax=Arundo donax TaxID=35708 RepID=A0A0A8YLA7_ARUDO
MEGSICHEFETDLAAADVWEVYGSLLLGQLVPQLLPEVLSKVELVEGDGGVGTVLLVTLFPSGIYKEKFIKVDNETYVKQATMIEGGFLNLGFQKYSVRFEIIAKEDKTSVIRSTIEYEVDEEHASNASLVSTSAVASIAKAITKYIKEQKSPKQAMEQTSEEQAPKQISEVQAPEQTSE